MRRARKTQRMRPLLCGTHRQSCCVCNIRGAEHVASRTLDRGRLTAISTKIWMNLGSYTVGGSVKAILETIYCRVSRYNIALMLIIFSRIERNEEALKIL